MIQSDFDGIAIGINSALVTVASLNNMNDPAEVARARAHNTSVATTARCIATSLGVRHPEFDQQAFIDECGMELGSDGMWRVPGGNFVPSLP
jgi:hypothetical protein